MAETLEDLKRRLRHQYLGKHGIHGVGIRRSENAVCLYVSPDINPDQEPVFGEIERQAEPSNVIVILEEPPSIS